MVDGSGASRYLPLVKLVCAIQLLPSPEQATALRETIARFNAGATWAASLAFEQQEVSIKRLHHLAYAPLRARFGLSAQMAVRSYTQALQAFKLNKKACPVFRPNAAMPFDDRMLTFRPGDIASILTLAGRTSIPFVMGEHQRALFALPRGQADLMERRDGVWILAVSVEVEAPPVVESGNFLGVDLGVVNLATDSDGHVFQGAQVEKVRQRRQAERDRLQQAAEKRKARGPRPKNIRRKLKKNSGREARFRKDVNHCISKTLVLKAKGTGRGIALEELRGIRDRTRFQAGQRAKMNGWAFAQTRAFITYKAAMHGVALQVVNARHTSRTCAECGYCAKKNRPSQAVFCCAKCNHTANADHNAARNIRARAAVNRPMVSERRDPEILDTSEYRDKPLL